MHSASLIISKDQVDRFFSGSLVDGGNCCVVKRPEITRELSSKLEFLISNPSKRNSIGIHGRVLSKLIESQIFNNSPLRNFLESHYF